REWSPQPVSPRSCICWLHSFYPFVPDAVEYAFRAGVRRRVGDFDVGEVGRRSAKPYVGGGYIDAFVDAFCADDGGTQDFTVRFGHIDPAMGRHAAVHVPGLAPRPVVGER